MTDTTPFLRVLSSLYVAVAEVFARETRQMLEGDKGLTFTGCANGLNPLDPLYRSDFLDNRRY